MSVKAKPKPTKNHTTKLIHSRKAAAAPSTAGDILLGIAREFESLPPRVFENIPTDFAKNFEHYMYGLPKEE